MHVSTNTFQAIKSLFRSTAHKVILKIGDFLTTNKQTTTTVELSIHLSWAIVCPLSFSLFFSTFSTQNRWIRIQACIQWQSLQQIGDTTNDRTNKQTNKQRETRNEMFLFTKTTTADEREAEKNDNKKEFTLAHKEVGRHARHSKKVNIFIHFVRLVCFFVVFCGFCRFIMSSESVLPVFAHTNTHTHTIIIITIRLCSSSCDTHTFLGCVLYSVLRHYHMQSHCVLKIVLSTIWRKTGDKRHIHTKKSYENQTANTSVSILLYIKRERE